MQCLDSAAVREEHRHTQLFCRSVFCYYGFCGLSKMEDAAAQRNSLQHRPSHVKFDLRAAERPDEDDLVDTQLLDRL